jgi:hypothetical protein
MGSAYARTGGCLPSNAPGEDSEVIDEHDELPAGEIEAAEAVSEVVGGHSHDGVEALDGSLAVHLQSVHGLGADPSLSAATQEGLHDRLHGQSKSSAD